MSMPGAALEDIFSEMTDEIAEQMIEVIKNYEVPTPESLLLVYLYDQNRRLQQQISDGALRTKASIVEVKSEEAKGERPEVEINYDGMPILSRFELKQRLVLGKEFKEALETTFPDLMEMLAAVALPSSQNQRQKRRKAIYPLLVVAQNIRYDKKDGPHPAVEAITLPDDITPNERKAADKLKKLLEKDESGKKVKTFRLFVLQQCANHRLYNLPEFSQEDSGDEETTLPKPESNVAKNIAELRALYNTRYAAIMAKPEAERAAMVKAPGGELVSAAISEFRQVVVGKVKDLLSDKDDDKKLREEHMTALILTAEDYAFVLSNSIDLDEVDDVKKLIEKIKNEVLPEK